MYDELSQMVGVTMVSVTGKQYDEALRFTSDDGRCFSFYHEQDCCENVSIEEVIGDLDDLVGSPIVYAEEVSNSARQQRLDRLSNVDTFKLGDLEAERAAILRDDPVGLEEPVVDAESYTWTFYRFATAKGCVTVRFLGTSNGYYGEGVSFHVGSAS